MYIFRDLALALTESGGDNIHYKKKLFMLSLDAFSGFKLHQTFSLWKLINTPPSPLFKDSYSGDKKKVYFLWSCPLVILRVIRFLSVQLNSLGVWCEWR